MEFIGFLFLLLLIWIIVVPIILIIKTSRLSERVSQFDRRIRLLSNEVDLLRPRAEPSPTTAGSRPKTEIEARQASPVQPAVAATPPTSPATVPSSPPSASPSPLPGTVPPTQPSRPGAVYGPSLHEAQEAERTLRVEPLAPQPAGGVSEHPLLNMASELTTPELGVEVDEAESPQEAEIARHAGVAELFRAFLQERNIRWIEVVATLIIVGFSIPLAITLWQQTHNVGKYLIFLGATLVIFGRGLVRPISARIIHHGQSFLDLRVSPDTAPLSRP